MPITNAFAYLIAPGKGLGSPPTISQKEIAIDDKKLSVMLTGLFADDPGTHDFEITFTAAQDGMQVNACRDLMLAFQASPSVASGLPIAQRLQRATDNRSGTGLFFLLKGTHGLKQRLLMSRFPTDQAIRADTTSGSLDIEFLQIGRAHV